MANRTTLDGSHAMLKGAVRIGAPAHDEEISFTIHVASGKPFVKNDAVFRPRNAPRCTDHHVDSDRLRAVIDFAHAHGLTVDAESAAERIVKLRGHASDINRAFGISLAHYRHSTGDFRGHTGNITVPAELADIVECVTGLDTRKIHRFHARRYVGPLERGTLTPPKALFPAQVAKAYDFPKGTGKGESIAIVELGGSFDQAVLTRYWKSIGLSTMPKVTIGRTSKVAPTPGPADGEVYLDICVIGAICPEAQIVLYFANNFADGIKAAINDPDHVHAAVSISWGANEQYYMNQDLSQPSLNPRGQAVQRALADASQMGIPVFISSGDNGSGNERDAQGATVLTQYASVSFPASSDLAIGCGGTQLVLDQSGALGGEVVWNNLEPLEKDPRFQPGAAVPGGATGGGVSLVFPVPDYQKSTDVQPRSVNPVPNAVMRGVPDICGNADPTTGYKIANPNGLAPEAVGGTSAVAPLWAALTALLDENLADSGKRVGAALNDFLYQNGRDILHDITQGDNDTSPGVGGYAARPGWDAVTGLGSPIGQKILAALRKALPTSG